MDDLYENLGAFVEWLTGHSFTQPFRGAASVSAEALYIVRNRQQALSHRNIRYAAGVYDLNTAFVREDLDRLLREVLPKPTVGVALRDFLSSQQVYEMRQDRVLFALTTVLHEGFEALYRRELDVQDNPYGNAPAEAGIELLTATLLPRAAAFLRLQRFLAGTVRLPYPTQTLLPIVELAAAHPFENREMRRRRFLQELLLFNRQGGGEFAFRSMATRVVWRYGLRRDSDVVAEATEELYSAFTGAFAGLREEIYRTHGIATYYAELTARGQLAVSRARQTVERYRDPDAPLRPARCEETPGVDPLPWPKEQFLNDDEFRTAIAAVTTQRYKVDALDDHYDALKAIRPVLSRSGGVSTPVLIEGLRAAAERANRCAQDLTVMPLAEREKRGASPLLEWASALRVRYAGYADALNVVAQREQSASANVRQVF